MAVKQRSENLRTATVFQAASLLLDYPQADADDLALVAAAVADLPRCKAKRLLRHFLAWWKGLTPSQRKVAYVDAFELGAKNSLYLTEIGHRDKRHRGRWLLAIKELYRCFGLEPAKGELPDFLPMVLEFAAREPGGEAVLREHLLALQALRASLQRSESRFCDVVEAVLAELESPERTVRAS